MSSSFRYAAVITLVLRNFFVLHQHFLLHISPSRLYYPDPFSPSSLNQMFRYSRKTSHPSYSTRLYFIMLFLGNQRGCCKVLWNTERFPITPAIKGFGHVAGEGLIAGWTTQVPHLSISNIWHWQQFWTAAGKYLAARYSEVLQAKTVLGKFLALTRAFS